MSGRLGHEMLKRLDNIETRLIRVESRVVQIMNKLGIKPKGAVPEDQRRKREKP